MDDLVESVPSNRLYTLLTLVVIILALIGAYAFVTNEMDWVRDFILHSGPLGFGLSILLFGVLGATPIPSEPLTIFLSTIYGPLLAMVATAIGNLLSALVEYLIGKNLGKLTNFKEWKQKLPFGLGSLPVDAPAFLLGARMLPGYGSKIVSLVAGFYHVPIGLYTWTTLVAITLGAALTAYAGYGVLTLLERLL